MSTVGSKSSPPGSVTSFNSESLVFDYPEADIILRSFDSYEFRVLKLYIVHSSPKLSEKMLISPNPSPSSSSEAHLGRDKSVDGLPVVSLPVSGAILYSLLTYIFPVSPVLPQTVERIMELLSIAQEYGMDVVLTQIRNHISLQTPSFIRKETAFLVYSLAQKYGLRTEALQAAKSTLGLSLSTFTITSLYSKRQLDMMAGASLHELWKYHKRVRSKLKSCIEEFMTSHAHGILGNSTCGSLTNSGVPSWLYSYIATIETAPVPLTSLSLTELYVHMATHIQKLSHQGGGGCSSCATIPGGTIHRFWEALTTVVDRNIAEVRGPDVAVLGRVPKGLQAEIDFAHIVEGGNANDQAETSGEPHPLRYLDMFNADVILQSSDLVKFRVHKAILFTSSPFFRDMFSLPLPSNDEPAGELPVVAVPEDAAVLNSLISMLYPVPPEIPKSSDAILALLSAAQKYDMVTVQSSIRAEASRRALLSPPQAEAFRMYAIAHSRRLIPEMETAARLTLDYPLTFESIGEALRSFEGRALQDLADFRRRCIYDTPSQLMLLSNPHIGLSKIWVGCPMAPTRGRLPGWVLNMLMMKIARLKRAFTLGIPTSSGFDQEYIAALRAHVKEKDCHFCAKVHMLDGESFCSEIKKILAEARNVPYLSSEGAPKV